MIDDLAGDLHGHRRAARMDLHAQTAALGLYERAGYTAYGAPFDDEGIEHLAMEKRLA